MKPTKIYIKCNLEHRQGCDFVRILSWKQQSKSILDSVFELISNHIKDKYYNVHRNKVNFKHSQYIQLHRFDDHQIWISNMLAADYQILIFDIFNLLAMNNYQLIFVKDESELM